jgi:hypothetical protein
MLGTLDANSPGSSFGFVLRLVEWEGSPIAAGLMEEVVDDVAG